MGAEVVIPSLRQRSTETLVWSLSQQTHPPDAITIVSNELEPFPVMGVPTRLLRFSSSEYGVGDWDVALRQNVGIFEAKGDVIVMQGDDQIAPPTMIEDTLTEMGDRNYIWGNHRLLDFKRYTADEIRTKPMHEGMSREDPVPPAEHGHWSCYGGMFAANADFLCDEGAFDMAFNGRHGGEDQALGFRLMRKTGQQKVWISEPPFSWHPIELKQGDARARSPWLDPITNGCGAGNHSFARTKMDGASYLQCGKCPVWHFDNVAALFRDRMLIRYRPDLVQTTSVWL